MTISNEAIILSELKSIRAEISSLREEIHNLKDPEFERYLVSEQFQKDRLVVRETAAKLEKGELELVDAKEGFDRIRKKAFFKKL